ncbi:MAG: hypothetical protein LCH54_00100 [Bacteroidetes bacterium]|nr:hypothetical protein [Bacteroidota bacterium]
MKKTLVLLGLLLGLASCSQNEPDDSDSPDSGNEARLPVEAATLVADANTPIYRMKDGYGANVTAISTSIVVSKYGGKLGSAYCELPPASEGAKWNSIFGFMNWSGLDWIRLMIEMNDFEPEKDTFTWDCPNFLRLLKILDWAQANQVNVLLQLQDNCTTWNTISGQDPAYSAPRDLDAFTTGFATMMEYLVKTKGYTCITMCNIANEPMNSWGWWRGGVDISQGYKATRAALDKKGISVPLVGPEFFQDEKFTFNWNACKPWLGAFETHNYADVGKGGWALRPISDLSYPVYWGEFGGGDNSNYDWNIKVAKWFVGGAKNKIDGFARWSYLNQNNIDGTFSYINTYQVAEITPMKNLYWQDGMVSRFTAKNSFVYQVTSSDNALTSTLFKSAGGNFTLIVVSDNTSTHWNTTISFEGLPAGITLKRYICTPGTVKDKTSGVSIASNGSFTVGPASKSFKDTIYDNSIFVYSTYNLSDKADGIVSDP